MQIADLRVEYQKNPIGMDVLRPRFSWKLETENQNTLQEGYQIQVILEEKVIWDSGCQKSEQSVLVEYGGVPLQAESKYEYHVKVWDNHGETALADGWFETGLLTGINFQAQWITHLFAEEETACPVFTKAISLKKPVRQARIYATALGVYEICVNGKKAGDTFFAPGWTNYKKRLQYQTYDVTELIQQESVLKITVGNGWYKGIFSFTCTPNHYGDRVAVLAELHVTYEDGTKEVIATDTSWKVKTGPIRYSEIYMGETIDSTFAGSESAAVEPFSYPT